VEVKDGSENTRRIKITYLLGADPRNRDGVNLINGQKGMESGRTSQCSAKRGASTTESHGSLKRPRTAGCDLPENAAESGKVEKKGPSPQKKPEVKKVSHRNEVRG